MFKHLTDKCLRHMKFTMTVDCNLLFPFPFISPSLLPYSPSLPLIPSHTPPPSKLLYTDWFYLWFAGALGIGDMCFMVWRIKERQKEKKQWDEKHFGDRKMKSEMESFLLDCQWYIVIIWCMARYSGLFREYMTCALWFE